MDIKAKISEISQSIQEIGLSDTAKKYKEITVGGLFTLLILMFILLPRGGTVDIGKAGCENFKTIISSYNSLPEDMRTNDTKKEVEKAEKIVKEQCN